MEPASHNRFYPSPYYPVFRSRMVMIPHPGRRECVCHGFFADRSAISPARRVEQPRAAGLARSRHPRGAPEQLPRGPDEPGVVWALAAAETLVEGMHARVAQHGGGFRIGHVECARGRTGFEQILDDAGQ